jgi:hypothetical protein
MDLVQREVPEREADAVPAGTQHFPHVRLGRGAERTLVIPVFDEGHRSRRVPEYVVTLVHGRHESGSVQVADHAGTPAAIESRAVRIPSTPGFTSIGER